MLSLPLVGLRQRVGFLWKCSYVPSELWRARLLIISFLLTFVFPCILKFAIILMRIQRHWRCSLFLFMILPVPHCTMIASVFPLMENFWLQPMVPHCSGYVLRRERFWIQLKKPMMVCPGIETLIFTTIMAIKKSNNFPFMNFQSLIIFFTCRWHYMHFMGP